MLQHFLFGKGSLCEEQKNPQQTINKECSCGTGGWHTHSHADEVRWGFAKLRDMPSDSMVDTDVRWPAALTPVSMTLGDADVLP